MKKKELRTLIHRTEICWREAFKVKTQAENTMSELNRIRVSLEKELEKKNNV